ncbi:MAG: hypothetical protein JWP15_2781 [Alphaproteobacteria bacterium]|nr:hypothetical protein [Alphaproteobacteria bacterium]
MTGRYLLVLGERRIGWEALVGRMSSLSGLEIAHNQYPVAVLRNGTCRCLALGDSGVIVGTLFHRHGPPGPIAALDQRDSDRIAASSGAVLLSAFWGGYVCAIADGGGHRVLRDPSGGLPCYFIRGAGFAAFASGADLLAACGLVRPVIDWGALARHLYSAGLPRPETVIDGVSELLPGFATRTEGSDPQEIAWNPWHHVGAEARFDVEAQADSLARTVRQAVQGWAASSRRIVLGVSGGLDSSIVAACLRGAPAQLLCVTLYTGDPAGDERLYARALCAALGLELIERPYRLSAVDIERPFAPQLPRPVGRIQAQAYDRALVEIAQAGCADRFMTGNGGDNVFGYSQSAAAIADRWLAEGIGRGLAGTIADTCRQTGCGPGEAIRSASRILRRRHYAWRPDPRLLAPAVLRDVSDLPLHHPWLEAPKGALPGKAAHIAGLLRAQHTLEPGRARFAPVLHPLLAQPVAEACLAVPSWEWRNGGIDRALARRAFQKALPRMIVRRRVKGTPDPFSTAVLHAFRPAIRDRLLGGRLVSHGLVDTDAIGLALGDGVGRSVEDNLRILELVAVEAWLDHWLGLAGTG